jgi:hypothetical protein
MMMMYLSRALTTSEPMRLMRRRSFFMLLHRRPSWSIVLIREAATHFLS